MGTSTIIIPVISKKDSTQSLGGPASLSSGAQQLADGLTSLAVDASGLAACMAAIRSLFTVGEANTVCLDEISVELGISASGKVGFLGTGLETEVAAKFELTFRRANSNE